MPVLDSLIVGGGPAGLAVSHSFQQAGVSHLVLEKGPVGAHIAQYPTFMRFFSTNENLQIAGFPMGIVDEKPSRREYLQYLSDFARYHRLPVETYAPVTAVEKRADGLFAVRVEKPGHAPRVELAHSVVVAVGAWDSPRRLGVPGEDLPKVRHRYTESHDYVGQRVLVVGGRNSAIETALQLWRAGAHVTLSYRGTAFTGRGVKYWLLPDIENRIANGEITGLLGSRVLRIDWEGVEMQLADGTRTVIGNDFVLPMLGYDPPVEFLRAVGIRLEPESNRPVHDPATLETTTPGLFVAGVITWGNISGHVFIENSRHHGGLILPRLREILADGGRGEKPPQ